MAAATECTLPACIHNLQTGRCACRNKGFMHHTGHHSRGRGAAVLAGLYCQRSGGVPARLSLRLLAHMHLYSLSLSQQSHSLSRAQCAAIRTAAVLFRSLSQCA